MTTQTIDVVLRRRGDGNWESDALALPNARVVEVVDRDRKLSFEIHGGHVEVEKAPAVTTLVARIELGEELVSASALERSKLDLEREKIASGERLARRTLIVSILTALLAAGATIEVGWMTNFGPKSEKPPPSAYKDLNECREALVNLKTLSNLDQQTLPNLRAAVRSQADACIGRLQAAMSASPS
jgi:hypothetical protein